MTTKRVPIGETSFSLAYRTEVIIPIDINIPTIWVERVVPVQNDTLLPQMLHHSEQRRQNAEIRIMAYQ